jgi:hypothetical protein
MAQVNFEQMIDMIFWGLKAFRVFALASNCFQLI